MAGNMEQSEQQQGEYSLPVNIGHNVVEEMKSELSALDPAFVHCIRLMEEEIKKLTTNRDDPTQPQKEKIFISQEDQKKYNLVGRLLGPKGLTLKRIQAETCTKMSILGKGSVKERSKEEELRTSGNSMYTHLNEELHVLIEAGPPSSVHKIAAGAAEVRKMLIPPEDGHPDFASKYDMPSGRGPPPYGSPFRGPPPSSYGARGGYPPMGGHYPRGGRSRMGNRGKGRPRDRSSNEGSWNREGGGGGGGGGEGGGDSSNWRDGTISKDYNHGVSSGGYSSSDRPFSSSDQSSYSSGGGDAGSGSVGYFSSFADNTSDQQTGGGGGGGGDSYGSRTGDWKSGHNPRRDYRYHPYENGPAPSGGAVSYY